MGARSSIEWLRGEDGSEGGSWNPIRARNIETGKVGWFCTHVNEACRFCYAETWNRSRGNGLAFKPGHRKDVEIFLDEKMLQAPTRWTVPRKIFPCSMTDFFGEFVELDWIAKMFAVMAFARHHTFIILTKRPERLRELTNNQKFRALVYHELRELGWFVPGGFIYPLRNVIAGTSVSTQEEADKFIPHIDGASLHYRCVSIEPLLGRVDLWMDKSFRKLDWVICGGESGPRARPMNADHARFLRDQCEDAGVAFHFKQWGQWAPDADGNMIKHKKKGDAGRVLDGREWNQFPVMKEWTDAFQ